jgi:FtsP/CotA-like multicopper oxidase with cupredoxin domain
MKQILLPLLASTAVSTAHYIPHGLFHDVKNLLWSYQQPLQSCKNTPSSRSCWGEYSVDTNYITTIPDTGNTVEVWLSAEESTCNPDGYERTCMTFNGTMPGPPIIANWGDNLVIHVTNNMKSNGTTVHWHGVRQLDTVESDGVPGVTQCPIRPGESMTYKYKVVQYGTSWYHSHISLQYSEGLFGPLIFNGPATADYDEDLGALFLQDWSHVPTFSAWHNKEKYGITQSLSNLLVNGTNTFDCTAVVDVDCIGGGKKSQTVFQPGKKYLIRLINVGTDSQFQFSIDGHKLKVIANDFVPIKPYITDSIIVNAAQRYDIVVEANAPPGDYWLRAFWVDACAGVANDHPENSTGIVRYDAASMSDPTSVSVVQPPTTCSDEPLESLQPHMEFDVTNVAGTTVEQLRVRFTHEAMFTWTINSSSLVLDWSNPTLKRVYHNESVFPTEYNVVSVEVRY